MHKVDAEALGNIIITDTNSKGICTQNSWRQKNGRSFIVHVRVPLSSLYPLYRAIERTPMYFTQTMCLKTMALVPIFPIIQLSTYNRMNTFHRVKHLDIYHCL